MKKMAIAALSAGLVTGILILITLLQLMGVTLSDRVITSSSQGDYVKYNSDDPYTLNIIKQTQPLNSNYIMMITGKSDKSYGHVVNYIDPAPLSDDDIKKTRIIWNKDGVEVTFPLGQKLYIPKERFIGLR
ncbi:MAG: hypothetical protein IAE90_10585 [Ignavibacteria bacterium]|nr:hypothetical protein [Ignavibacteria bacterium]